MLLAGAALLMAACSEAPTAPSASSKKAPSARSDDITCLTGYEVAYDQYGNPYCAPDGDGGDVAQRPGTSSHPHP
jgi:hypothetical protein